MSEESSSISHFFSTFQTPDLGGQLAPDYPYDQIQFDFKELNLLADLGFLGIDQSHPNAILPYKKPRGKELTALKKQINHAIGAARVRVEHAFSGVKRLKIIRNKIRLKTYQVRDQVFRIAVALHNLRVSCRTLQVHS